MSKEVQANLLATAQQNIEGYINQIMAVLQTLESDTGVDCGLSVSYVKLAKTQIASLKVREPLSAIDMYGTQGELA